MNISKTNCTHTVNGRVKELYAVTESLKFKSEKIKFGFLPIGQKRVPAMGKTAVGSSATVSYNPSNPTEAFITHNIGKTNI